MLTQLITTFFNTLISRVVNTFNGWRDLKFYFVTLLIFFASIGFIYKDVVTMGVQNVIFNQIRFRDCRDLLGLQKEMDRIVRGGTVEKYVVYLYQPENNSFYKKAILTNSEIIMRSPALQGMYLKDQPSMNQELMTHDYYLVDKIEAAKHPDLQYMIDISDHYRLFYALKVDGKVIGEIAVRFKNKPNILEMEQTLKQLSPLLYNYIL